MAEPHPIAEALPTEEVAYIGLGANLDDPRRHVETAAAQLGRLPSTRLAATSALYRTAPLGPADQPDYINAVARIDTWLTPEALLAELQAIERQHGRVRNGTRWGPRTLDLDLLTFGDRQISSKGLMVPHPEMHRRAFVLVPLADVAPPGLWVPGRDDLATLLASVSHDGVERLASMECRTPPASSARRNKV
jgi:2-amino-4-hydroxy-6-hydroxymethyldihydropteridine diphosphokinase